MIAPAASTVATAGATAPEAMATTMAATMARTDLRAAPEGDELAAHGVGAVDDQDAVARLVLLERGPRALDQEVVARFERDLAHEVLAPALDGEDHEVARLRRPCRGRPVGR